MEPKAVIIGLDGGSLEIVKEMVAAGKLPVLGRFIKEGVYGNLESTANQRSPSAWTSFLTGKNPGKHGIYEFYAHIPGSYQVEFLNASFRQGKSFWKILSDNGRRVGIINVPLSYPAERVDGFMISGVDSPSPSSNAFTWPSHLITEIEQKFGTYILEPDVTRHAMNQDKQAAYKEICRSIDFRVETANYLFDRSPCDLSILIFRELDPAQHFFWGDNLEPDIFVYKVYEKVDDAVGRVIDRFGKNTNVFIVSDHGFGFKQHGNHCMNEWLHKMGLLAFKTDKKASSGYTELLRSAYHLLDKNLNRSTKERLKNIFPSVRDRLHSNLFYASIDWGKTMAYSDNITAEIWVNLKGRERVGIVEKGRKYEELRSRIIDLLSEVRNLKGEKIVESVFRREEIYYGEKIESASDLLVRWKQDVLIDGLTGPGEIRVNPDFPTDEFKIISGDHRLSGMLMAKGSDILKGFEINGASIMDIAPTILYLFDNHIDRDMDGKVLKNLFDANVVNKKEIVFYDEDCSIPYPESTLAFEKEEAELVRERLKALGYTD